MENYYSLCAKVLFCLGIEFTEPSKTSLLARWLAIFLRYSSPIILIMISIQSLVHICTVEQHGFYSLQSVSMIVYSIESFMKDIGIAYNQEKLLRVISRCKEFYSELDEVEKLKSSTMLLRLRTIVRNIFIVDTICLWLFNLLPIITLVASAIRQNELEKTLPYELWWPFDPLGYYSSMMAYYLYIGNLLMVAQNAPDHYFVLIVADIASHFDRLGDRIKVVINDADNTTYLESKSKLRDCIIRHGQLIQLFDILNDSYGNALLTQFLATSVIMCFTVFIILVTNVLLRFIPVV